MDGSIRIPKFLEDRTHDIRVQKYGLEVPVGTAGKCGNEVTCGAQHLIARIEHIKFQCEFVNRIGSGVGHRTAQRANSIVRVYGNGKRKQLNPGHLMNRPRTGISLGIGRGVGVDTELVVSGAEEKEGGSTIIGVEAALHNDEITEFPTTTAQVMIDFVQYLVDTDQSVFTLFRSMDLDDSGKIDSREFLAALESSKFAGLSSIDASELVESMDLDGDGELNLPELDIAIAQIKRDHDIVPSEEEE